jgi:membrane fusion protein, multidrug efflux system
MHNDWHGLMHARHQMTEPLRMNDAPDPHPPATPVAAVAQQASSGSWLWPLLRVAFVIGAGFVVWFVAGNWNRWSGAVRYARTDDAYMTGDLTPLAAKVSGYVARVTVSDFQTVQRGDVLVEIEPADYQAQLEQAQANLAAAKANLANLDNQKAIQRALIRQAEATIQATAADVLRYHLEATRQRELNRDRLAGTQQAVEQGDANERRTTAQLVFNSAQLDQQKAVLDSLDVQKLQLEAQVRAAEAQVELAGNSLGYTKIVAPADGMAGQRQVRPGQFVNVGTQVVSVMPLPNIWVIANYKETQMTNVRLGQTARVTVDAFPDVVLHGRVESWSPGTGSTFALLAPDNATGNFTKVVQRVPVKVALDPDPALGTLVRPGMSVEVEIDTDGTRDPAPATPAMTSQRSP